MDDLERKNEIDKLIKEAKICPNKGRYYVYERYKQVLIDLGPTHEEYEQACRQIAKNLNV